MQDKLYRGTTKTVKVTKDDTIYAGVGMSRVLKLNAKTGKVEKRSGAVDPTTQSNDIALAPDGGIILVGLNYENRVNEFDSSMSNVIIRGSILKLDDQLNLKWSKFHGNYPGGKEKEVAAHGGITKAPDQSYVYTECWGTSETYSMEGLVDGYAMYCAYGVEQCQGEEVGNLTPE